MLVLSRKIGQRILIDSGIEVEILSVQGNRVKVGIAAPSHVAIRRPEVNVFDCDTALEPTSSKRQMSAAAVDCNR